MSFCLLPLLNKIIKVYCDQQIFYYATLQDYLRFCSIYVYLQNPLLSIILSYLSHLTDYIEFHKNLHLSINQPTILDDPIIRQNLHILTTTTPTQKADKIVTQNEWVLVFYWYHLINETLPIR